MPYTVIENTPGYLPDEDDPPVFEEYAEALNYLIATRVEILDADWAWDFVKGCNDPKFMLDVSPIVGGGFFYTDKRREHDLGRIVQIVPVEEES